MKYSIPQEVQKLVSALVDNGHEAYLIGGCVRFGFR